MKKGELILRVQDEQVSFKMFKATPQIANVEKCFKIDAKDKQVVDAPKEKLMNAPNWNLPFEIMCDASDFAIRVVLGQRRGKDFQIIYYTSRTLNDVQQNYTIDKS